MASGGGAWSAARGTHEQNWYRAFAQYLVRIATEDQPAYAAAPMRAHCDEIGMPLLRFA